MANLIAADGVKPLSATLYVEKFPKRMQQMIRKVIKRLATTIEELGDDSGRIRYKSSGEISYSPLILLLYYFFGGYHTSGGLGGQFREEHSGRAISRPVDARVFFNFAIKPSKISAKYLRVIFAVKKPSKTPF
jgi:hypothetical protein